jgi:hypothetical protein
MNWKMKLVAASLALVTTAPASAALVNTQGAGNSSLFLTVWNATTSYTRDLGTTLNGFLTSFANTNTTFGGDSLFTSTFGANPTGIQWNVAAGDTVFVANTDPARMLVTGAYTLNHLTAGANRNGIFTVNGGIDGQVLTMNASGCSTNASCVVDAPASGYGGNATWGANMNGGTTFSTTSTTTDLAGRLGFYLFSSIAGNATVSIPATGRTTFTNGTDRGYWMLASNGDAVWTNAASVGAIPVPAAAWLLGSGLLGLVGVARRKQKALAQA